MVKTLATTPSLSRLLFGMSVLLSPSACAAGMPSVAATTTKGGRVSGRSCMSISSLSAASGGCPVVCCRISQLPDQRGAQFIDRLTDQIRGLEFVGGIEVTLHVAHHLCIAAALRYLVADAMSIAQGGVGVGEVIAGTHRHIDQIGHHICADAGRRHHRRDAE